MTTATRDRLERYLLPLGACALVLAAWHGAVVWSGTRVFPSPAAVVRGVAELARRGLLASYVASSLGRVAAGYTLALVLGIPLGLLMGWSPLLARAANPLVQLMRPISPIAWIPVAIVLFGVGTTTTVFLVFLGAFFPIVLATANGARSVPPMFLRAGRNFGLAPAALFARVALPAMLPQLLTGLRIALGVAWIVLVAGEMVAVDSGLGYLILDARNAGKRYDLVVAGMLLIGTIGLALDAAARRLERLRAVRWGFHSNQEVT